METSLYVSLCSQAAIKFVTNEKRLLVFIYICLPPTSPRVSLNGYAYYFSICILLHWFDVQVKGSPQTHPPGRSATDAKDRNISLNSYICVKDVNSLREKDINHSILIQNPDRSRLFPSSFKSNRN